MEMYCKCQVCGKEGSAREQFDLKDNVPGGMKATCLECVGRLEEREACAKVAELEINSIQGSGFGATSWRDCCLWLAAVIRARSNS